MLARAPRNVTMGHVDNGLVLGRLKELGNSRSVTMKGAKHHQLGGPWNVGAGPLCYRTRDNEWTRGMSVRKLCHVEFILTMHRNREGHQ